MAAEDSDERVAKFTVTGDTIIYDTETIDAHPGAEIDYDDHEELLRLLQANPDVTTLQLNSLGGRVYAGYRLADIVIDFGLDTVVDGVCASSCVYVLLGGETRRMEGGSRIGFHHRTWGAAAIERYYDRRRKDRGWSTLFDFSAWLYVDTQQESYEEMQYYLERGVDAAFVIETTKVREDGMWYPRRARLVAAGVLTE